MGGLFVTFGTAKRGLIRGPSPSSHLFAVPNVTAHPSMGSVPDSGPSVWNDLPPTLRSSSTTLGQFQSRLKTTLFHLAYGM